MRIHYLCCCCKIGIEETVRNEIETVIDKDNRINKDDTMFDTGDVSVKEKHSLMPQISLSTLAANSNESVNMSGLIK